MSEMRFTIHAATKTSIQVSPDDFETVPVVLDVDPDETVGMLVTRMHARLGVKLEWPITFHITETAS